MQGDGYDQVGRAAERAVIQSFMFAGRVTANLTRLIWMGLRSVKRSIQKGTQGVQDEKTRLQREDSGPSIAAGSEQKGRGDQQRQTADHPDDLMSDFKRMLYYLLPQKTMEQVSFADFSNAFDRLIAKEVRVGQARNATEAKQDARERNENDSYLHTNLGTAEKAHDKYIRERWGPNATFDNVWQEGLKERGMRSGEDALVVWASASSSTHPSAPNARANAEGVLRREAPAVMKIYDQNRPGLAPWVAMSDAYQWMHQGPRNSRGTHTAREERTSEQAQSSAAGQPSQPENRQGRDTQQGQRPALPPGPAVGIGDAVRRGPQGPQPGPSTRGPNSGPNRNPTLK